MWRYRVTEIQLQILLTNDREYQSILKLEIACILYTHSLSYILDLSGWLTRWLKISHVKYLQLQYLTRVWNSTGKVVFPEWCSDLMLVFKKHLTEHQLQSASASEIIFSLIIIVFFVRWVYLVCTGLYLEYYCSVIFGQ